MLKNISQSIDKVVTQNDLSKNSSELTKIVHFRLLNNPLARALSLRSMIKKIPPYFDCLTEKPKIPITFQQDYHKTLFNFSSFWSNETISEPHQQLRSCCQSITESKIAFGSSFGVSIFDSMKNSSFIISSQNPHIMAFNKKRSFLGIGCFPGFLEIIDLNKNLSIIKTNIFEEDELINKISFFDESSSQVFFAGNSTFTKILDLEKLQIMDFVTTTNFVNDADFNQERGVFAFAMDCCEISVIDPRCKKIENGINLKGHLDFNFSVKFLDDYYLASGGQDITTRIWDLRKNNQSLHVLAGIDYSISAMEYKKSTQILYCAEAFAYFYAFDLKSSEIQRQMIDFFGFPTGISFSPSKSKIFMGISRISPGIIEFVLS